jgi:hypothetical protein
MTDQQVILKAFADVQEIATDYIEPGRRDPIGATRRILDIIEHKDVLAAAGRLAKRHGLRVVK